MVIFFALLFLSLFIEGSYANPLININPEDQVVYDNIEASDGSKVGTLTIMPYDYYQITPPIESIDRVKLNLNIPDTTGFFIKPLSSITSKFYITDEEFSFLEGQSGLTLIKGGNLFLFEDGYISYENNPPFNKGGMGGFSIYYQLKQTINEKMAKNELFRAYMKFMIYKYSIEVGKDNVNLGPGEYGVLLSDNVEPYPLIKFQTEMPLEFFGKWDILFLRGWLQEERRDVSNPSITALRLTWKPLSFLELGGTRTTMYEGDGRPQYSIEEYPELIIGAKENVSGRFNNDAYGGWDASLYLPLNKWFPSIRMAKLYYLESGGDVVTPWQEGFNRGWRWPLGFTLYNHGDQAGIFLSTENDIFRFEWTSIASQFGIHGIYSYEGYTYKGLFLGYPYGRDTIGILLKHRHYFDNSFSLEYKIGGYERPQPNSELSRAPYDPPPDRMTRYFVSLMVDKRIKNFITEGFVRFDKTERYDEDPLSTQWKVVDKDKTFYTLGISCSWRF